jgi:glycine/D-amino acid oxidase-like deaminating enzyme
MFMQDPRIPHRTSSKRLRQPELPLPFETYGSVCFDNQAQFHPRKYLCAVAREIEGDGCYIFEKTRALGIEGGSSTVVKTDRGSIRADYVIQATHHPIVDKPGELSKRLSQSMTYALGVRIKEPFPDGMFIYAEKPGRSLRSQPTEGGEMVIVVGDGHPTGNSKSTCEHYKHLEDWVRSIYKVHSIDYHWSTKDVMPDDGVLLVGRITPGSEHLYVATGFRKWGMTTGTAAAMILTDTIFGRYNSWVEVYDHLRSKYGELLSVQEETSRLAPGRVLQLSREHKKVAAYQDLQGVLYTLDPSCRMGCQVSWNEARERIIGEAGDD